jgi:hypothetical protein
MQVRTDETHEEGQGSKQERRRARGDLLALLKRLRKLCDTFKTAEEWLEYVDKQVRPVLDRHQSALGADTTRGLREAARITESTRAGVRHACRTLRFEIEKVLPLLPAPVPLAVQVAAGILIGAAALVGAGVIALNVMAVQLEVRSLGCELEMPAYYSSIPGFSFPEVMPSDGTPFEVSIISAVELDTSQPERIVLRLVGREEPFQPVRLRSMVLDEEVELMGRLTPLRLESGSRHTLVLRCE